MSWLKTKKSHPFEVSFLFFCTNHFSIRLLLVTKSDDQLSSWTEKTFQSTVQSQTCTQQWSRPLFGGLLPVWSTTAFWISMRPLHLRNMLSNWMRCTENCNACSWHWSTERTQFFYVTTPNCTSHNQRFKSWTNWGIKFCLTHLIHLSSHQLTTTF